MSLVTVKRQAEDNDDDDDKNKKQANETESPPSDDNPPQHQSTNLIEFEKEFNFHNLKQIYTCETLADKQQQTMTTASKSCKPTETTCLISLNLIEKYFVIKDAALIMPRRKRVSTSKLIMLTTPSSESNESNVSTSTTGEILTHLKSMVHLLRPCDTISVAVKLNSYNSTRIRYLVIVETVLNESGSSSLDDYSKCCKESAILGLDLQQETSENWTCTVGLVMPIYANCEIGLNGDGGFIVKTHSSMHIFKPVSIQAMWSSYQYLLKAFENARKRNFYSHSSASLLTEISSSSSNEIAQSNHEWVKYYASLVSRTTTNVNEWYQKEERSTQREDFTTPYYDGIKLSKHDEETGIRIREKLKEIMMSSKDDYGSMSSVYIRELLEKELGVKLDNFKKFIDVTIFQFYNQLVECATEVLPYLYLGTEWNASNYDALMAKNITHILNVSSEVDNFFPDSFKYLNIRVLDVDQTDLIKEFDRTNRFIQEAREQASSCLVHCKMGVSRSASVCLAYLMKENDWSFEQAFAYTKQKRSCINPNDGFRQQLATYESILNAHKAKYNLFEPSSASTVSLASQEQLSNTSTSPPPPLSNRNSLETNQPLLITATSSSTESDLVPKMFVKETINKLKSISSSDQLPVKLVAPNSSPPLSPAQQEDQSKISSVSFVLSPSNIKRTQSHLTSNEIRKKIDDSSDTNENFYRVSSSHIRSKSNTDNKEFFSKLRQSWSSTDNNNNAKSKLHQLNIYSSETNLNSTSSSSSSSSLRSAVRNSLNMNEEHLFSMSSGNVKRQVEAINFKSRPCTPQIDELNMNKRQSILSLGETIAEVEDTSASTANNNNIKEAAVSSKVTASLSPDGKRFKHEQTKQLLAELGSVK